MGTSLDRAGTAVCLVWLVLFEGVFFFGAVWCLGLVVDLQGLGVGVVGAWGSVCDSGLGSVMSSVAVVDGPSMLGLVAGPTGRTAVGIPGFGSSSVWVSGSAWLPLGLVLLPVLGSLLVLLVVSLVLQWVHRGVASGAVVGHGARVSGYGVGIRVHGRCWTRWCDA
eukprot:RCo002596